MPNFDDGTWLPLGCFLDCCHGGSSGPPFEYCDAICDGCTVQVPCDICVQITEWTIDSENRDCGFISIPLPQPWASNIHASVTAAPLIAYYTKFFSETVFSSTGHGIRGALSYLQCRMDVSGSTWHFSADYVPEPPCALADIGNVTITDTIDLSCGQQELFGTHTIEETRTDPFGNDFTIRVTYTVTPGRGCGVTVSGCPKPISKHLTANIGYGDTATVYLESTGGATWTGAGVSDSAAHDVRGTVTYAGGVWHGLFTDNAVTVFDADLNTGDACLPGNLSGTDVAHGSSGASVIES
jgi:hypothetical protein